MEVMVMSALPEPGQQLQSSGRIAVAGVYRSGKDTANFILGKLRKAHADVVAINPNADAIGGEPCYRSLDAVPGGVDAVFIATRPEDTEQIVQDCARLKIRKVWMHRSFGEGSVSAEAAAFCRANGISVIDGACPAMYIEPDVGHRCFKWILGMTGKLPRSLA